MTNKNPKTISLNDSTEYGMCFACGPKNTRGLKLYFNHKDNGVDNQELIAVNKSIRQHPVERIGETLRDAMTAMTKIV